MRHSTPNAGYLQNRNCGLVPFDFGFSGIANVVSYTAWDKDCDDFHIVSLHDNIVANR